MADFEYLAELFEPVGGISVKRMFSGAGIYRHGVIFALVIDDIIYLKADDSNRPDFEAENSSPFTYTHRQGREVRTSYWRVPDRLLDDPEELRNWSMKAVDVSIRAAAAKPAKRRKPPARPAAR